ncbi:MAG: ATP-binding cassette domain-containing protein [Actinobacteria bacterium]|nr:ATP-binding cassette domain-containing protein [Actinomycetota bacterium]
MSPPTAGPAPPPVLELDGVTFGYSDATVLRAVSLSVREGEFVAVVGPNGSGKTTLLRLSLGLLQPHRGKVRLFGIDAASFREWWRLGYVPQRAVASSPLPLSVEEVVRTGLAGRERSARRGKATSERLEHVIDLMGLSAVRRRRVSEVSGGQQQRALIARALVTAPRLLVLDEPTTGVDAAARAVLRESLEHLVGVEGMGVVYVSHDPGAFAGLADRVLEVEDGGLVDLAGSILPSVTRQTASAT